MKAGEEEEDCKCSSQSEQSKCQAFVTQCLSEKMPGASRGGGGGGGGAGSTAAAASEEAAYGL